MPLVALAQRYLDELNRLSLSLRLGSFRCDLLYWGMMPPGAWRNYPHGHSFVEVCYAFAGQGTFHIHGAPQRVRAGDLFVARPGEPHYILSSARDALGICFWAHTLERAAPSAADAGPIDRLVEAFLASPIALREDAATLPRILDLLGDEVAGRAPAYGCAVEALAATLLIASFRAVTDLPSSAEPADPAAQSAADVLVRTIIRYLEDNYQRPISMCDVVAQIHVSERHVRRLFRRLTGVSPMDYLTAYRLRVAARLLLADELPIKEVAAHCGYPDVQYFSALCRRHLGMPPGRFRAQRGVSALPGRDGAAV